MPCPAEMQGELFGGFGPPRPPRTKRAAPNDVTAQLDVGRRLLHLDIVRVARIRRPASVVHQPDAWHVWFRDGTHVIRNGFDPFIVVVCGPV